MNSFSSPLDLFQLEATTTLTWGECSNAQKAFFKINAFKKHHRFNPGKTFDMRKEFLGECKAADPEAISKILSKFGRVRG